MRLHTMWFLYWSRFSIVDSFETPWEEERRAYSALRGGLPHPTTIFYRRAFDNENFSWVGHFANIGEIDPYPTNLVIYQLRWNMYFNGFGSFNYSREHLYLYIMWHRYLCRFFTIRRFCLHYPSHGQRTRSHARGAKKRHKPLPQLETIAHHSRGRVTPPRPIRALPPLFIT